MDRRFREDENELPYLLSQKRDKVKTPRSSGFHYEIIIEDRPFSQFASAVEGLIIPIDDRINIINSVEVTAKNCTFSINDSGDRLIFQFVVENRYVKTFITVYFENHQLSVSNYYIDHGKLESQPWFKSEVSRISREIGLDFYTCSSRRAHEFEDGHLTIEDNCSVLVIFGDGDFFNDHPGYKIDFKRKRFVEYHIFAGHEAILF